MLTYNGFNIIIQNVMNYKLKFIWFMNLKKRSFIFCGFKHLLVDTKN